MIKQINAPERKDIIIPDNILNANMFLLTLYNSNLLVDELKIASCSKSIFDVFQDPQSSREEKLLHANMISYTLETTVEYDSYDDSALMENTLISKNHIPYLSFGEYNEESYKLFIDELTYKSFGDENTDDLPNLEQTKTIHVTKRIHESSPVVLFENEEKKRNKGNKISAIGV